MKYLGDVEVRVGLALSIRKSDNSEDFALSSIPSASCVLTFSPQNPYSAFVCDWTYPDRKEVLHLALSSIGNLIGPDVMVKTTLTFFEKYRNIVLVSKSTLSNDLLRAIKQQPSDVVFIVGEVRIDVHKFLLCARSDVFRTMFESTMKETQTNEIIITGYHVDAVRGFVSYLYSDTVDKPVMKQHAMDLLRLSHMYNIEGLNLLCQQHLVTTLSNENVFDHLKLADLYSADHLQNYSAEHIVSHAGMLRNMHSVDLFTTLPMSSIKLVLNKMIDQLSSYNHKQKIAGGGWCVIS